MPQPIVTYLQQEEFILAYIFRERVHNGKGDEAASSQLRKLRDYTIYHKHKSDRTNYNQDVSINSQCSLLETCFL